MDFHVPSFALGYAAGFSTQLVARHLRPLIVEAATAAFRLVDLVVERTAMRGEDLEDLLAEAKARARRAAHRREAHAEGAEAAP